MLPVEPQPHFDAPVFLVTPPWAEAKPSRGLLADSPKRKEASHLHGVCLLSNLLQ